MRLVELAEGCFSVPARLRDLEVSGLSSDSRQVKRGDLFVALPGARTDGHLYVLEAVEAGAVAVLGEKQRGGRPLPAAISAPEALPVPFFGVPDTRVALGRLAVNLFGDPSERIATVGVTGTKGKTTTAWLLDTIFTAAGKVSALFGTVHNRVGAHLQPSSNTTPSCLEIHRALGDLISQGGTHAVLEVSSHGIVQRRTAGIRFRAGIFTNVAPEHLDYHKTFESYLEAKTRFFVELPSSSYAILSREEPASARIAQRTAAAVVWYGADGQDGVDDVRVGERGMTFRWKGREVRSRLWGAHNLLNILAAMTCAECLGFSPDDIVEGIERAEAPPGRLEFIPGSRFRVFVDYAHTDGSLVAVLKTLRAITRGRLITVFGCGGDRDRTKRPRMGHAAERWSDHVVVTSDNPRGEEPESIIREIAAGLLRPEDATFVVDRREAIGLGIRMAKEGDTVLIAGKGHETYQEIAGRKLHFDDREVAREFLREATLTHF